MKLSAAELSDNLNVLLKVIDTKITGDRKEKLLQLHDDWGDRIAVAPASMKTNYHNAFVGGYVLHVLNVIKAVGLVADSWKKMGVNLDFTQEEMYFSAICHDLGKMGTEEEEYYLPCEEQWMLKKGQLYVMNPRLQYMKVAERSIMNLQKRGIVMTEKEYLSIKLHDGLYEDSNKAYLISYSEDYALKTYLPHVLHQADMISAKSEEKK
jgi:23S rRNA maturation-related 3'-5' exoribonuclease YhaM